MGCVPLEERERGDLWKALSAVSIPAPGVIIEKYRVSA